MTAAGENSARLSLPARMLGGVVSAVSAHPRLTLWLGLLMACAAVGITVADLTVRTSRADLVDPGKDFAQSWLKFSKTFGATSDLIVVVETPVPNPRLLQSVLEEVGKRLESEKELFRGVLYRVDQTSIRQKGLQFLSTSQLSRTAQRVDRYQSLIQNESWNWMSAERMAADLRRRIAAAENSSESATVLYRQADRFGRSLSQFFQQQTTKSGAVETAGFQSPIADLLTVAVDDSVNDENVAWLMNDKATIGLLQAFPVAHKDDLDENARSIRRLREIIADVNREFQPQASGETTDGRKSQKVSVSLTGIPVLEHDEMHRSTADMINAALVAFVAVSLLMFAGFRGMRHPMLAILNLIVAICWTFGALTLCIGHLNILSVSFGVILIGLGIDFSIHFLSRYLTLRQELFELRDALRLTGQSVGTGILMSAVTTALAFGTSVLTGVSGLAELGIISAIGLLLCALATFIFLPALIALSDEGLEVDALPQPRPNALYRRLIVAWPVVVVLVSAVGIGAVATRAFQYSDGSIQCAVKYDPNLMKLQDRSLESVMTEAKLAESGNESLLYAVAVADSWEETLRLRQKFMKLPSVGRVSELASRLPPEPDERQRAAIRQLQSRVAAMGGQRPQFSKASVQRVGSEIEQLYFTLRDSPSLDGKNAAKHFDEVLKNLETLPGSRSAALLDAYQYLTAKSLLQEFGKVASAANTSPVDLGDLPDSLRSRYLKVDAEGHQHWLIRIYPKNDIWEAKPLEEFVREIRTVSADVSGVPVQNYESTCLLHHSFRTVGLYSLAVVSLILLFNFLRPGQKLLTVVPPLLVAAFIGYTVHQRTGAISLHLPVAIALALTCFIAVVLDYRNLRDTLLALLPPLGGGVLLLGAMVLFGWELNPVNLIVMPLVLGIGVDNGIHLLQDYRRQVAAGTESYSPSAETVNSVFMDSVASMVGFGSLMVAAHGGLFSLGVLLSFGIAGCLFVALIPLPALLSLVARYQPASLEPVRLRTSSGNEQDNSAANTTKQSGQQKQKKAA
ncbi:MAG: MMPL family transporter [Planctomyces sp.]